jgi:hypothetical protein
MKYVIHNKKKQTIISLKNNIVLFINSKGSHFWLHSDKKYKDFETIILAVPSDYYLKKHFPFIKYEAIIKKTDVVQDSFVESIYENYYLWIN